MKVTNTLLPEVLIIEPDVHGDSRGYFMESWSRRAFESIGISADFVQDNESFTREKGTLRGLHFQLAPMAQAKLVRAARGAVLDVAVDLRRGSPHYLEWTAVELSEENKRMLYVPRGFAHGFLTLSPDVLFVYKADNFYSPGHDRNIRYDDAQIGVDWGGTVSPILSAKDAKAPLLKDSDCNFVY